MKCCWILARRWFSEIYLAQFWHSWMGWPMDRWSNSSVAKYFIIFLYFMSGRSAAW